MVGGGAVLGAAGGGAPECAPGLRAGDIAAQDRAPAEPGSYNKRGGSSRYDSGHAVLIALDFSWWVAVMLSFDIESLLATSATPGHDPVAGRELNVKYQSGLSSVTHIF